MCALPRDVQHVRGRPVVLLGWHLSCLRNLLERKLCRLCFHGDILLFDGLCAHLRRVPERALELLVLRQRHVVGGLLLGW